MSDFHVIAEGLRFPEGPIAMPDGTVLLVEIARGTLTLSSSGRLIGARWPRQGLALNY